MLYGVIRLLNETRPLWLKADNTEIAKDKRIRVKGRSNMTLIPDFFMVDIYNLSEEDELSLRNAERLSVFGESMIILCSGEIQEIYTHVEQSNEIITVSISDGMKFWKSRADIAVSSGVWCRDAIKTILKNAKFGLFLCDDFRMPRGQTFSGRTADFINEFAISLSARAYILNNTLNIVGKESEEDISFPPHTKN